MKQFYFNKETGRITAVNYEKNMVLMMDDRPDNIAINLNKVNNPADVAATCLKSGFLPVEEVVFKARLDEVIKKIVL